VNAFVFALGAAFSWGTSQVISKAGLARMRLARFVLIRTITALICIIPFGLATSGFVLPRLSLIGWAALAGALDCFLGVLMFMLALKRISAHEAVPLANGGSVGEGPKTQGTREARHFTPPWLIWATTRPPSW